MTKTQTPAKLLLRYLWPLTHALRDWEAAR